MMGLPIPLIPAVVDGIGTQLMQRRQLYAVPMSKLRMLMICCMANPEEGLTVEDENGNIVRETIKGNDSLVQYKKKKGKRRRKIQWQMTGQVANPQGAGPQT